MNYNFLMNHPLFTGIKESEMKSMLDCLGAVTKTYQKEEIVYAFGEETDSMGLVLSGSILIENDDIWGNRHLLNHISIGQVFAEAYACIPGESMLVNAVATEESTILFLNIKKVLHTCSSACSHHSRLISNLLTVLAKKNLSLTQKIFHTSSKSIRGRILSYLSWQAKEQKSYQFEIPFNRQQLADYLEVDRSALSNELSKMKKEGLIEVQKNLFRITPEI